MLTRIRSLSVATTIAMAALAVAPSAGSLGARVSAAGPVTLDATLSHASAPPFFSGSYTLNGPTATYSDALVITPSGDAVFSATVSDPGTYTLELVLAGGPPGPNQWTLSLGTTVDLSASTNIGILAPAFSNVLLQVTGPPGFPLSGPSDVVAQSEIFSGPTGDWASLTSAARTDLAGRTTVYVLADSTNASLSAIGSAPLGSAFAMLPFPVPATFNIALPFLDGTPPTITITAPLDGASYPQNSVVKAGYGCQDETGGSGLASCIGPVGSGSSIDTSSIGPHAFNVTATDNAGNTTIATASYTVVPIVQPCPATIRLPFAVPTEAGSTFLVATLQGTQTGTLPSCQVAYKLKVVGLQIGTGTFDATYGSPGVVTVGNGTLSVAGFPTGVTFSGSQSITGNTGVLSLTFVFKSHRTRTVTTNFTVAADGTLIVTRTRIS